jgi:hypothetical protein
MITAWRNVTQNERQLVGFTELKGRELYNEEESQYSTFSTYIQFQPSERYSYQKSP